MNNYTKSQQLLHQIILGSNFLREVSFDIEKTIFLKNSHKIKNNHVFITGLARSGTTILLNAIYKTQKFASLTYKDMPFILSPNLWSNVNNGRFVLNKQERAHEDGIKIDADSPEAFEEVFWNTFDQNKFDTIIEFTNFMRLICIKNNKRRYLSKNNQNIRRINILKDKYPYSKIIIPFREPLQHAFSLFNQHKRFIYLQKKENFIRKYMYWIGHSEFGVDYIPIHKENIRFSNFNDINHWLEQWYLSYNELKQFKTSSNIMFVCYEELCTDNTIFKSVLDYIEAQNSFDFDFRLSHKEIKNQYIRELYHKCLVVYDDLKTRT